MAFRAILTLAVAAAPAAAAPSPSAAVLRVDAALERWDMAEARSLAATMPPGADRCAVEGIITSRTNQLETAAKLLPPCLAALERNRSHRAETVFETLLNTYLRRGEYGKHYALLARWLGTRREHIDPNRLSDLRDQLATAAVLRDLPKPSVTGRQTATLRTYLNVLGTRTIDLTVRDVTLPWLIDTGANFSVVSESAARRLRLEVRDAGYHVAGSTGHAVTARLAVIDKLPVGGVILRNMMAIVVPDEALRIRAPHADYRIDAVLGLPALTQFGRFRIEREGDMTINRDAPPLRSGALLFMNELTPLAEVEIAGRRSLMSIDTGANRTTLYASYAASFTDRARLWPRTRDATLGLGGISDAETALEPELTIGVGAATVAEHGVPVALDGDRASPILGNLGQSGLSARCSYTFDFRSMRLLLGDEAPKAGTCRPNDSQDRA
ncbi:retropepsin-like aspartic protease [Sphingomonas sp. BK235]|uniref:retropepsin-like aspartic protease family protein n=1 Tax=Sphingomonas sp. BK235 TaxID=2512131 RepID=UPI0010498268|nr:retropepsin-like aspartic protease [Sphingomonas sp. BK235]TCP29538.1 aspartyl protease [Sphingomonas sp. BK235]